MKDFDYDVKQKKALVPSARKRVNGSKSKRCTLPSDNLTSAQKKKLNGPVCTYSMNRPMDWRQFKDMPEDLQEEYVRTLRERYTVSQAELARMFGVTQRAVANHVGRRGYGSLFAHGRMSAAERIAWHTFCTSGAATEDILPEENPAEPEEIVVASAEAADWLDDVFQSGTIHLSGDGDRIGDAIARMLSGRKAEVTISFSFTHEKEEIE